jgi:Secretion system C-terminal sorting domain
VLPVSNITATGITTSAFVGTWTNPAHTDSVLVQISNDSFATIANGASGQVVKGNSLAFTGQTAGTYKLRVKRYRNGLSSLFATSADIILTTDPPPTLEIEYDIAGFVVKDPTLNTLVLSWSGQFRNAESILIEQSVTSNDNFNLVGEISADKHTFLATRLNEGSLYHFRLKGKRGATVSQPSSEAKGYTIVLPAEAYQASDISGDSFTANWQYPPGTDSIQLQVSNDEFKTFLPGLEKKFVRTDKLSITGLQESKTYHYRVVRFRSGKASIQSVAIVANTGMVTGIEVQAAFSHYPNPVTDFLVIDPGQSRISVNIFSSSGASHYSSTTDSKLSIDMRDYAAGMYFLGITEGLTTRRYKVVKR